MPRLLKAKCVFVKILILMPAILLIASVTETYFVSVITLCNVNCCLGVFDESF